MLVTSTAMTLGEFGVFNLPSALGSVVPSLVIMCPHHFHFLTEAHIYLFQCEKKKEGMFCLKWLSLPS